MRSDTRDGTDARFLQKLPKMAKITPNDLVALKIVLAKPQRNTEQNTLLIPENSVFLSI